eukprot:gene7693-8530_t
MCTSAVNCHYFIQYKYDAKDRNVVFKITGKHAWIALGLTENPILKMPFAQYLRVLDANIGEICQRRTATATLMSFSTKRYRLTLNSHIGVKLITAAFNNGTIYCEYSRQVVTPPGTNLRDLNKKWYITIAFGNMKGNQMKRHSRGSYSVSNIAVDFTAIQETSKGQGSRIDSYFKAHGVLMMLAWHLLLFIGMFIARYLRGAWGEVRIHGKYLWLQNARAHFGIGITAFASLMLEVICGSFRPSPDSPWRLYFIYAHRFIGIATLFIGGATILLGLKLLSISILPCVLWFVMVFLISLAIEGLLQIISKKGKISDEHHEFEIQNGPGPTLKKAMLIHKTALIFLVSIFLSCIALSSTQAIDASTCGTKMGCYRYPTGCSSSATCNVLIAFKYNISSDSVDVSISTKNAWVAFGLCSAQNKMGETSGEVCFKDGAVADLKAFFNTGYRADFSQSTSGLNIISKSSVNGSVICKWVQHNNFGFLSIDIMKVGRIAFLLERFAFFGRTSPSAKSCDLLPSSTSISSAVGDPLRSQYVRPVNAPTGSYMKDLKTTWFITAAYGNTVGGSTPGKHEFKPSSSSAKVDLRKSFEATGKSASKTALVAHGSLMIIAWLGFAATGMFIARYMKKVTGDGTCCGEKIWFQSHRICMTMTLLLTVISFIIIFVKEKGWSEHAKAHPYTGCITTFLAIVQPIMAIFRPHPNEANRWLFNWGHRCVGVVALTLAVATIFLGLDLMHVTFSSVIAWVVLFFIIVLIMEVAPCCIPNTFSDEYEMSGENSATTQQNNKGIILRKVLFVIAAICFFVIGFVTIGFVAKA